MFKPFHRACLAAVSLSLSGAALAAGNTPITNERTALRSVLTGYLLADEVPGQVVTLGQSSRQMLDQALHLLASTTTPAQLAAAGSVDIPCNVSGNIRARMASTSPRVVRFEWIACAIQDEFGNVATSNGPGEVTLIGESFTPKVIASMRLGDRTRDFVSDQRIEGNTAFGGFRFRLNLRATGLLPMTRQYEDGYGLYVGRYAYETTGFYEVTSYVTNYPDPGPPFYPQVITYSADGVIVAGDFTSDTTGEARETRVFRGTLAARIDTAPRPGRPSRTYNESVRLYDLRMSTAYVFQADAPSRKTTTIDGKAEANVGQYWGFPGCTQPETFTWRTPQPMSYVLDFLQSPDRGQLRVNDNVTTTFRQTGTEPYVDLLGHIDIGVRGVGNFNFTTQYDPSDLAGEAGCAP